MAEAFLILLVLAFSWSIGAHYTGACMGMPYGSGSIRLAPCVAVVLGYFVTHALDRTVGFRSTGDLRSLVVLRTLGRVLVAVGLLASWTMGATDASNATGVLLMTHGATVWTAGAIGGIGLMLGVLTWGCPLLRKGAW